jgi:hypothetical protein
MCACAVNGFSAFPFSSDDLVAIHREIDAKAAGKAKSPLTIAQFSIVFISLLAIGLVYSIADKPRQIVSPALNYEIPVSPTQISSDEKKTQPQKEVSDIAKTFKKVVAAISSKKFERNISPLEQLPPINAEVIISEITAEHETPESNVMLPHFNSDVIYIYDLKVCNYNKLYFGSLGTDETPFKTHTPVFRENKESSLPDLDPDLAVLPADRVLKEGLIAFNKQRHSRALEYFDLLLENNPYDINARFYSALCHYNLGNFERAVADLNAIQATNNSFNPEAQWFTALITLKRGNKYSAKQMLEKIVEEKGFYSKRAKEKLAKL